MSLKPITLHGHLSGPNPWKVAMILEELEIPYTSNYHDFPDLKKSPYVDLNPNGRVPAIEDPNTGITLWESGAIIQYLIDTYDKHGKISFGDKMPEKYQTIQWLTYQVSGQGPYFGQNVWFHVFHSESLPSAKERYMNESKRVVKVLDSHLAKTGTGYLVGNKATYADISFVMWNVGLVDNFLKPAEEKEGFLKSVPHFMKWHDATIARPAVAKVLKEKADKAPKH